MFFHLSLKKNKWRKRLLHHLLNKKTNKKKEQIKIQRIGRAAIAAFFLNLFIFFLVVVVDMKIFSFPSYLPSRSLLAYGVPSRATAISHWPAQRPMMKRRTAPSQGPDKVKEIGFTKHQPPPPPGPPLRARWGQR